MSTRVQHKFAKYNDKNQLTCAICKTIVPDDGMWDTHLQGRSHLDTLNRLNAILQNKGKQPTSTAPSVSNIPTNSMLSRNIPSAPVPVSIPWSGSLQSTHSNRSTAPQPPINAPQPTEDLFGYDSDDDNDDDSGDGQQEKSSQNIHSFQESDSDTDIDDDDIDIPDSWTGDPDDYIEQYKREYKENKKKAKLDRFNNHHLNTKSSKLSTEISTKPASYRPSALIGSFLGITDLLEDDNDGTYDSNDSSSISDTDDNEYIDDDGDAWLIVNKTIDGNSTTKIGNQDNNQDQYELIPKLDSNGIQINVLVALANTIQHDKELSLDEMSWNKYIKGNKNDTNTVSRVSDDTDGLISSLLPLSTFGQSKFNTKKAHITHKSDYNPIDTLDIPPSETLLPTASPKIDESDTAHSAPNSSKSIDSIIQNKLALRRNRRDDFMDSTRNKRQRLIDLQDDIIDNIDDNTYVKLSSDTHDTQDDLKHHKSGNVVSSTSSSADQSRVFENNDEEDDSEENVDIGALLNWD